MNRAGVLLDTGPIVALLSRSDANHDRARRAFASCAPPFRCCEAVIAEACHLLSRVHREAPAEVLALGRKGVFTIGLSVDEEWSSLEFLLKKYADRPTSLADACLIRMAELHKEPRILTFDSDFGVYRWARNRRFRQIDASSRRPGP
jgi:predicted nucleic acid-binding protein